MKKIFGMWIIIFVGVLIVSIVGIRLDLWANPWLKKVGEDFTTFNYFSTGHGLSVLYFFHFKTWLAVQTMVAALFSSAITYFETKYSCW